MATYQRLHPVDAALPLYNEFDCPGDNTNAIVVYCLAISYVAAALDSTLRPHS